MVEAAMIAANVPPGLDRSYFGFSKWLQHDVGLWQNCLQEAESQIDKSVTPKIFGSDYDNRAIEISRANAVRAYLIAQGASRSQIEVISYGEEKPAKRGHSESAWAQNRRVEIVYR